MLVIKRTIVYKNRDIIGICDPFFQVWLNNWMGAIFARVTHFSTCDPFFSRVWAISPSVAYFSKGDPLFQVWPILASMTHFPKCDPFFLRATLFF